MVIWDGKQWAKISGGYLILLINCRSILQEAGKDALNKRKGSGAMEYSSASRIELRRWLISPE